MSFILFFIILAILVFVHELGHFAIAKWAKVKVLEFGLGFPPRLWGKKYGETIYSINAIPFGGFVQIFGEDSEGEAFEGPDKARAFVAQKRHIQAAILLAGVTCNFLFAWFLFSVGYMSGFPASVSSGDTRVENARLIVTDVLAGAPAQGAGIEAGTEIHSLRDGISEIAPKTPEDVKKYIEARANTPIEFVLGKSDTIILKKVIPQGETGSARVGISMDQIGTLRLPFFEALGQGGIHTLRLMKDVLFSLLGFIRDIFTFNADFSQVTGPLGIATFVGKAQGLGWMYLLSFSAFISVNLGVLNLLPFPALDGGRLLFVIIEAIIRRPLPRAFSQKANQIGFAILLLLMLVVTVKDIVKFF